MLIAMFFKGKVLSEKLLTLLTYILFIQLMSLVYNITVR